MKFSEDDLDQPPFEIGETVTFVRFDQDGAPIWNTSQIEDRKFGWQESCKMNKWSFLVRHEIPFGNRSVWYMPEGLHRVNDGGRYTPDEIVAKFTKERA